MLKFFFNKESKVVYTMEIVGAVLLITLLVHWWPSGRPIAHQVAFYLFIIEYILIRFCVVVKWYDEDGKNAFILPLPGTGNRQPGTGKEKYKGIDLQFKKAMVPTSYILALISALLLIGAPAAVLYFADFLLAVIVHVNIILIYFHVKDKETLPVNYFTHNRHLGC